MSLCPQTCHSQGDQTEPRLRFPPILFSAHSHAGSGARRGREGLSQEQSLTLHRAQLHSPPSAAGSGRGSHTRNVFVWSPWKDLLSGKIYCCINTIVLADQKNPQIPST